MMNRIRILRMLLFISIIYVKCEQNEGPKSKHPLPYFRRKVEEIGEPDFMITATDDPHNLVSFMVNNVREIFDDIVENSEIIAGTSTKTATTISNTSITPRKPITALELKSYIDVFTTEANMSRSSISTSTHTNDVMLFDNLSFTALLDKNHETKENLRISTRDELTDIVKGIKYYGKTDKKQGEIVEFPFAQPYHMGNSTEAYSDASDPRRSCIMCNNVASEDCNDPKNKLIPSIMCERNEDLCYSLHTPFGIIDRGCFNVNHNLTTYVCSCNLCNYISISEMPFTFFNKRDWVDNVIELSRTRHFRKSVFKDMSCLRCEVNTTSKTGDMLDSANCLEGNIGNLPIEDCAVDEVCAVKALKADGYIWRGCIKSPLYNYWWSVCDQDLCNYDTLVTLYDFII